MRFVEPKESLKLFKTQTRPSQTRRWSSLKPTVIQTKQLKTKNHLDSSESFTVEMAQQKQKLAIGRIGIDCYRLL